jgi:transposase
VKNEVRITIELKEDKRYCTSCGSNNFNAVFVKEREIKGIPIGTKQTTFVVRVKRLRCHACGCERQEWIACVPAPKVRYTKSLARSVVELRQKMSIKDVAEFYGLHWGTVKDIEKKYLQKKFKRIRLKNVEIIGMDEFHTGDGFITIVRDLDSGAVLHVGEGKGGDALERFEKRLRSSNCKIKAVAVDLAPSYTAWVRDNIPQATIVYDHFHLIKLMNKKVDDLRRKTMKEADEEMKEHLKKKDFFS